jgi:hypothetical protein
VKTTVTNAEITVSHAKLQTPYPANAIATAMAPDTPVAAIEMTARALKFSLFVSNALCTWPNEPIKKAVDINTTRGVSLGSPKKAAINGAEAANANVSNAPRPTFIQKVEDNVSSLTSFFCTIADVNPKLEKMATKLENTVTIAIRPKSLGVSNLAKIANTSIDISS